jgi:hypothetical protein
MPGPVRGLASRLSLTALHFFLAASLGCSFTVRNRLAAGLSCVIFHFSAQLATALARGLHSGTGTDFVQATSPKKNLERPRLTHD